MELDQIQNDTCASASSVFSSALCSLMWLLSKIDLLTILQSNQADLRFILLPVEKQLLCEVAAVSSGWGGNGIDQNLIF